MNCLRQLFRSKQELPAPIAASLETWRRLEPVSEATELEDTRFVVVDVETTGLNPRRDKLLSIGAFAVEQMRLASQSTFSAVLHNESPSSRENIVVHGLTPTTQASGEPPDKVLSEFLLFAGKSPCVAFHADFDRTVLQRAMHAEFDVRFANPWLDLARLAPALFPEARLSEGSLDDWLAYFQLQISKRHDAVHDAHCTAELLLIVLARAGRQGVSTLAELRASEHAQRNYHRM